MKRISLTDEGWRRLNKTFCAVVLHGVINHMLNENKKLYVAFIDYTKAFDNVVRENIWYKLLNYGVRGKIIDAIRSMYENIKSKVKYENRLSNDFTCL